MWRSPEVLDTVSQFGGTGGSKDGTADEELVEEDPSFEYPSFEKATSDGRG